MQSLTNIAEIIGLFIAIIVIAVFRAPIWKAIKELFMNLLMAFIFTVIVVFLFNITQFNIDSLLFIVALAGIFTARFIYFKFLGGAHPR